jgi:predicted amidophosphoribosyltransferase
MEIGRQLGIPFYEDVASCRSRHRVDAVFDLLYAPPERNVILFDDFVTTGSTLKAMKTVLEGIRKNVLSFTGINNKL